MAVDLPLGGYTIPWTTAETYEEAAGEGDQIATENGQIDVSGDRSYTVIRDKEPEKLVFVVSVAAGDTFSIPTSGVNPSGYYQSISYDWAIDWGDGDSIQRISGVSTPRAGSEGIPHSYISAGKYAITIWPGDGKSSFAWARAFGFYSTTTNSSSPTNKAKVTSVIEMPTKGFLQSATATGAYYLYSTWYGCTSLTRAVVPDTSNLGITSIGVSFLGETWQDCTSLLIAAVPDTSLWDITSIPSNFLRNCWYGCTSLTTAVAPDTFGWRVNGIGAGFLESAWRNCTSLTKAVVPDTSGWDITSSSTIERSFLWNTWGGCTGIKDISNIKLCNGFKEVYSLYRSTGDTYNENSWLSTFALPNSDSTTTGAPPSFYDGTLITSKIPESDRNTFTNRTGMTGYNNLDPNWK
jgi:hypothetical protein